MRLRDLIIRQTEASTWEANRRELDLYLRDVAKILNGGFRARDQLRTVRDLTINSAHIPFDVGVPSNATILGVVLVGARRQSDGHVVSGGSVEWSTPTPTVVRIHALSALAPTTIYDLTLAMVE